MRLHYRDPRGTYAEIVAGRRLGGGAEGDVFTCHMPNGAETQMCVKLCSEERRYGLRERLDPMMQIYTAAWFVPGENHLEVTWPVAVAEDDDGEAIGFFMNVVSPQRYLSAQDLFAPHRDHRTRSWGTLIAVAADLARVVAKLHASGIVIGDLALQNIWVSAASGRVTILDCDSFTFPDMPASLTYRAEYTPPEGGSAAATVATDEFALAVAICLLLAESTHPFAGIDLELKKDADRTRSANIANGRSWLFHDNIRRPQTAPLATILPPEVRAMASQAFEIGLLDTSKRPSAEMWHRTLVDLVPRLDRCTVNQRHVFDREQPHCPWCLRTEQRNGRDPFPGDAPAGSVSLGLVPAWLDHASSLLRLQDKNAARTWRLQQAEQARRAEQEKQAEQARRAEQEKQAEQARRAEQEKQAEQARRAEQEKQAEQERVRDRNRVERIQATLTKVAGGNESSWATEGKDQFLNKLVTELFAHPAGWELLDEGIDTLTLGHWLAQHIKKNPREPSLTSMLKNIVADFAGCEVVPEAGGKHYVLRLDPLARMRRATAPPGSLIVLRPVQNDLGRASPTAPAPMSEPAPLATPSVAPAAMRLELFAKELDVTLYELKQRLKALGIRKWRADGSEHEVIEPEDVERVRAELRENPPRPSLHDQRCAFWAISEMDWLSAGERSRVHLMLGLGSVHEPGRKTGRLNSDDDADAMVATLLGDPGHPRGGHATMTSSARNGVHAAKQVRDYWVWDGPNSGHVVGHERQQMTNARTNTIEALARAVSGQDHQAG